MKSESNSLFRSYLSELAKEMKRLEKPMADALKRLPVHEQKRLTRKFGFAYPVGQKVEMLRK